MLIRYTIPLLLALIPLVVDAQSAAGAIAQLRNRAILEGAVDVKVTTRPIADSGLPGRAPTEAQRIAIQRAQHRILVRLLPRGLVVGNEITMQPDGSFTMRVLPTGLDYLAASPDVAILDAGATRKETQR